MIFVDFRGNFRDFGWFFATRIRIRIRFIEADPDPDPADQNETDPYGSGWLETTTFFGNTVCILETIFSDFCIFF